ncbi:MAG: DUF2207 domain-containing protein, partial [Actinobacteria bacterium]|nr:DUF2207 domain-containing protein [Actinomycetota bacterium]
MRPRVLLPGVLLVVLVSVAVVVPATAVSAKSYWMEGADVTIEVEPDGSLTVTEVLAYDFSGSFTGAYRDIRLRSGENARIVSVGDESGAYQLGGCTTLGCSSPAGTYGVEEIPGYVRVVWHHSSQDEVRRFFIRYVMSGVAVVYDDVVDVNFQVWGDGWSVGANRITARVLLPSGTVSGEVRVWGHPFGVNGVTSLGVDGVSPSLEASGVPPEQWVEMRVVFPASLLASTTGAQVRPGDGLERILAEEVAFAVEEEEAARA